jgi:hypothetical protein
VVLVETDPRVTDAISVALSPWGLVVATVPGPIPGADVGAAAEGARAVAVDQGADAVVWIAPPRQPSERASLWVYDAQTQQLAVRPVNAAAPFTDSAAAAIALSVKTILRASPLLAEPERTEPSPPPAAPSSPPPRQTRAVAPASPPTDRMGALRFEAAFGGRAPTGTESLAEPWVALGASLWPAGTRPFGFGLEIQAGPGTSVHAGAFRGMMREGSAEMSARVRALVANWLAFELGAGPALYVALFEGVASSARSLRYDPAFDVAGVVDFVVAGRVAIGIIADGSVLFRYQAYHLQGALLFSEPPIDLCAGLRLSVGLD